MPTPTLRSATAERYDGLSYAEYAALPGLRSSDLHRLAQSPLHYRAGALERHGMEWLQLVHTAVLEPHLLAGEYAVWEGGARRGKAWEAWRDAKQGRRIVTQTEYQRAMLTAAHVRAHPLAAMLLSLPGHSEVTITWEEGARTHKARPDRYALDHATGEHILIDLKTYGTTDPRVIARRVAGLGAHVQAAHYRAGVQALLPGAPVRSYLIVAEGRHPWDVAVVELTADHALHLGAIERDRLLALLDECEATDTWPGRCPTVEALVLPAWAEGDDDIYLTDSDDDTF